MSIDPTQYTHTKAKKEIWSGRITALCGFTAAGGTWYRTWFSGPKCPACKRIKRGGR